MPTSKSAISRACRAAIFAQLKALAPAIREAIAQDCEIVLHDFTDLEHSIIWMEGNVTNRKIGGSLTDLGLAKIRAEETEDAYNYTTYGDDGRTLRSSSTFLSDQDGEVFGAVCINVDITPLLAFQHVLNRLSERSEPDEVPETFSDDIHDILKAMLQDATDVIGVPLALMTKEDKVELVSLLDEKGAFQVKKAVPFLARRLGVSRYTIYNYLNESRERREVTAN